MAQAAIGVDRGQPVPGRERDDQLTMNEREPARRHDQASVRSTRKRRDGSLDLAGIADVDRAQFHPERRRRRLDRGELAGSGGYAGIPKDRRSRHARRDLLDKFQPFSAGAVFEQRKPGGIAARLRQAFDNAGADRIGNLHENDRHGAGRLLQRHDGRRAIGQDDVGCEARAVPPRACECARNRPRSSDSRSAQELRPSVQS